MFFIVIFFTKKRTIEDLSQQNGAFRLFQGQCKKNHRRL